MATATLGVNIVLVDGAKAGLDALGLSFINLRGLGYQLGSVWNSLSGFQQTMGITAGVTGLAFGALAAFVLGTVHAAADLESEMTKVSLSVDGADESAGQMKDTLINLADSSKFSSSQVADAFAQIGIDGFNASDIIGGMGQKAILLAEALNSDTTPAANLLSTAMELYGAKAAEAGQYTNDLTFLFFHGQKTIQNVQAAITMVGQQAHLLKIPFGELADVLALLGEDGLKGGNGAAALNYYLTALSAPIPKVQHALAALGLLVVNDTSPAFFKLKDALIAAGDSADANKYDGTVHSLNDMFTAAVKVGALHTDKTFMEWADSVGILNNKMYDANGQFIGLKESILKLGDAMKGRTEQQKVDFIGQLFNVRSGRAARDLLTDIETQLTRLGQLDALRQQTDAAHKAAQNMGTLNNVIARLKSTWTDTMARIGATDLGPLKGIGNALSDMLHAFNTAGPKVQSTVTIVLLAVTAFTGLAFVVSLVVFAVGLLAPVMGTVGPILLGVAAGIAYVAATAAVLKMAFDEAQKKGSALGSVLKPVIDFITAAWKFMTDEIQKELMPALAKLGIHWETLKMVGMFLLVMFVMPFIAVLGVLFFAIIAVVTVVTKLVDAILWLKNAGAATANFIGMVFQKAFGGLVSDIQMVIGWVQKLINSLSHIPGIGLIGKAFGGGIPGLADGGVVTAPQLAVIGEGREPEVVMPLSKLQQFLTTYKDTRATSAPGSMQTHIHLEVGGREVATAVLDHLNGTLRQNGLGRAFR